MSPERYRCSAEIEDNSTSKIRRDTLQYLKSQILTIKKLTLTQSPARKKRSSKFSELTALPSHSDSGKLGENSAENRTDSVQIRSPKTPLSEFNTPSVRILPKSTEEGQNGKIDPEKGFQSLGGKRPGAKVDSAEKPAECAKEISTALARIEAIFETLLGSGNSRSKVGKNKGIFGAQKSKNGQHQMTVISSILENKENLSDLLKTESKVTDSEL